MFEILVELFSLKTYTLVWIEKKYSNLIFFWLSFLWQVFRKQTNNDSLAWSCSDFLFLWSFEMWQIWRLVFFLWFCLLRDVPLFTVLLWKTELICRILDRQSGFIEIWIVWKITEKYRVYWRHVISLIKDNLWRSSLMKSCYCWK